MFPKDLEGHAPSWPCAQCQRTRLFLRLVGHLESSTVVAVHPGPTHATAARSLHMTGALTFITPFGCVRRPRQCIGVKRLSSARAKHTRLQLAQLSMGGQSPTSARGYPTNRRSGPLPSNIQPDRGLQDEDSPAPAGQPGYCTAALCRPDR